MKFLAGLRITKQSDNVHESDLLTKKVGLIGIGYIGTTILDTIIKEANENLIVQAVYDIDEVKMKHIAENYPSIRLMKNLTDFQDCDIVVECAVQQVVEEIFDEITKHGISFIPMSIGAFISIPELFSKYQKLTEIDKKSIVFPSGVVGGFDCVEIIKSVGIKSAKLQTRKPNRAFDNNEYIGSNNIKLNDNSPVSIFKGNAKLAATYFPRSINVAARLALSTIGPEKTLVEIIADPSVSKNIHTIEIESEVGQYKFIFENNPSPTNPKTSWLAALSAIYAIKTI